MTNKSHLTRCARLAIAATLALGSTPLLAQQAAAPPAAAAPPPTIVIPDVAPPPPAAAPTIVIPEELTQPEPQAAAPRTPARTTPRATTPTQTRAAAPRPAPVAAAPEPVTPDSATTDIAPLDAPVAAAPLPEPIAAPEITTASEPANDNGNGNTFAIVLGALAVLGLALLGFFALRRKGPKRYAAAAPTIEKPVVHREPAQPLADLPEGTGAPEFPAAPEPQPALAQTNVNYSGAAFGAAAKPATSLSHSGAAVALPRELPATYEEREALIQRMVAAAPDRANPFRSYRARLKRARLILASLGRDFKDADPWIDLSQYPSNWPELARRQSAAA